jgi:hypothetical protein
MPISCGQRMGISSWFDLTDLNYFNNFDNKDDVFPDEVIYRLMGLV